MENFHPTSPGSHLAQGGIPPSRLAHFQYEHKVFFNMKQQERVDPGWPGSYEHALNTFQIFSNYS